MIQSPTLLSELADHNVQKVGVHEGDITEIGNLRLTWKVRGASTGFQFGIYQTELTPGAGVPLHKHPFAEFLYVLDGSVSFARVNPGKSSGRYMTLFRGSTEIQKFAGGEKVPDLVHFHGSVNHRSAA